MRGIIHPFSKALYERDDSCPDDEVVPANVRILVSLNEKTGLFTGQGRWVSGDIKEADPHLCGWIAGPRIGNHRLENQTTASRS